MHKGEISLIVLSLLFIGASLLGLGAGTAVKTTTQNQISKAATNCDDPQWYCINECASAQTRAVFGQNATKWRAEKAKNEGKTSCDTVSPTNSPCISNGVNYCPKGTPTPQPQSTTSQTVLNGPCSKAEGCGGQCDKTVNNGCGYGGCRAWEECGNGSCQWQNVKNSCEDEIKNQSTTQTTSPTGTSSSSATPSASTNPGTDTDWTCMRETALPQIRAIFGYDFNRWRNEKVQNTIKDCKLDTSKQYDCSSVVTDECVKVVQDIIAKDPNLTAGGGGTTTSTTNTSGTSSSSSNTAAQTEQCVADGYATDNSQKCCSKYSVYKAALNICQKNPNVTPTKTPPYYEGCDSPDDIPKTKVFDCPNSPTIQNTLFSGKASNNLLPEKTRAINCVNKIACITPNMIVIHWSGSWTNTAGISQSLISRERSCQLATDADSSLVLQNFYDTAVEYPQCAGKEGNWNGINIEIAGKDFDSVINNSKDPQYNTLQQSTKRALILACTSMKKYNISTIKGHLEIPEEAARGKDDPGQQYTNKFREWAKQGLAHNCDFSGFTLAQSASTLTSTVTPNPTATPQLPTAIPTQQSQTYINYSITKASIDASSNTLNYTACVTTNQTSVPDSMVGFDTKYSDEGATRDMLAEDYIQWVGVPSNGTLKCIERSKKIDNVQKTEYIWVHTNPQNETQGMDSDNTLKAIPPVASATALPLDDSKPVVTVTWNEMPNAPSYHMDVVYNGNKFSRDLTEKKYEFYPYELRNQTGTLQLTISDKSGTSTIFKTIPVRIDTIPTVQPTAAPVIQPQTQCAVLKNQNAPYKVVIIPDRYSTKDRIQSDAEAAIDGFQKTNLPDAIKNKVQFMLYSDQSLTPLSSPKADGVTTTIIEWDKVKAEEIKARCNANDYLIIAQWPYAGGTAFWSGGAAITNAVLSLSAHELGHSIAKLDDEYVYLDDKGQEMMPEKGAFAEANCTADATCSQWKQASNTIQCSTGCHYKTWFRPTENSIMRNPYLTLDFNVPSLQVWERWALRQ